MAISEAFSGTEAVGTTEHSLTTDTSYDTGDAQTTDGIYQLFLDVSDMVLGDELQIRLYEKCRSGDTQRVAAEWILAHDQATEIWVSPSVILMHGWDWTLDALAGTITVLWSIRSVAQVPTYTVNGNNKTSAATKALAYANLGSLFVHAAPMALTISAVAINATTGVVTVTMTNTLTTDQKNHLGLVQMHPFHGPLLPGGARLQASGAAYSLDCQPGTFTLTGTAATLAAGRVFNAAAGSYTVTGAAATTARGLFLTASPGTFTVTGTAATVVSTRVISAAPGAFAVTGSAATVAAGRVFSADPGVFTITGVAATLVQATPGAYVLSADPGTFTLTGTAMTPAATRLLSAIPGTFTVSGSPITAGRVLEINAAPGSYTLTGVAVTFQTTRSLSADPGAFAVTGVAAELRHEGQAPNMDEILTGWIASAVVGRSGGGVTGRIRTPTTGSIA